VAGKTRLAQFQPTDPTMLDVRTRAELDARVKAAEAALGGARADVERTKADLTFAQSELTRARGLVEQKVIAPRELEAAERQAQALPEHVRPSNRVPPSFRGTAPHPRAARTRAHPERCRGLVRRPT